MADLFGAQTMRRHLQLSLTVNGEPAEASFAPYKTLLEVLREDLGLTGTKHGCELGAMAKMKAEFDRRNVKIIGLSADPVDDHKRWAKDIEETQGTAPNYPMIGDSDLKVAKLYDMLPAEATPGKRTAADNATVRTVFVIGPDKKIKLMLFYPMTTGRNFDEVLRVLDSIQHTAKHKVATPANWKQGQDVIIAGSVNDEDAKKLFPQGWKAPKPYLRITQQPK